MTKIDVTPDLRKNSKLTTTGGMTWVSRSIWETARPESSALSSLPPAARVESGGGGGFLIDATQSGCSLADAARRRLGGVEPGAVVLGAQAWWLSRAAAPDRGSWRRLLVLGAAAHACGSRCSERLLPTAYEVNLGTVYETLDLSTQSVCLY